MLIRSAKAPAAAAAESFLDTLAWPFFLDLPRPVSVPRNGDDDDTTGRTSPLVERAERARSLLDGGEAEEEEAASPPLSPPLLFRSRDAETVWAWNPSAVRARWSTPAAATRRRRRLFRELRTMVSL